MSIPKWLIAVLAVVAAIAVGVAALFIGARFAAPEVVASPAGTTTVPIIGPVALASPVEAESPSIGEQVVSQPVEPGPNAELDAILDEVLSSPDPAETIYELETLTTPADTASDACAEDDAPAECPSGLHSTILPLTAVPTLRLVVVAFPPTEPTDNTAMPYCDFADEIIPDGTVPVGIFSNLPGVFTLDYWPITNPDDVRTQVVESDESAIAATAAALEADVHPFELPPNVLCTFLSVESPMAYSGIMHAVDAFGGEPRDATFAFHSDGEAAHPTLQVTPLGDNLLVASALHKPSERVQLIGIRSTDGTRPGCPPGDGSGEEGTVGAWLVREGSSNITPDQARIRNVAATNTENATGVFVISEGEIITICASWYPEDLSSFDEGEPTYISTVTARSPDLVLPTFTTEAIGLQRESSVSSVRISLRAAESGYECGITTSASALPARLCQQDDMLGAMWDSERFWDIGYSGNYVLSAALTRSDGSVVVSESAIDLGRVECDVTCPSPSPLLFRPVFMDGDTRLGSAQIRVEWQSGFTNGASGWQLGGPINTSPEYELADVPQLNTNNGPVSVLGPGETSGSVAWSVEADRPVTFEAHVVSFAAGTPCTAELGAVTRVTGSAPSPGVAVPIRFSGLCLGEGYHVVVTLTATDGAVSTWGPAVEESWHEWEQASFIFPGYQGTLFFSVRVITAYPALVDARLRIGEQYPFAEFQCLTYGAGEGLGDEVAWDTVGEVPITIGEHNIIDFGMSGQLSTNECIRDIYMQRLSSVGIPANVTMDELMSPSGVRLSWGSGIGYANDVLVRVTLRVE